MRYAFISGGRCYVHDDDGTLKEISSKFAKEKDEEGERQKSLYGWKSKGQNVDPYFRGPSLWGGQAGARPFSKFRFKSVMVGDTDILYYLLSNNFMTGLFKYNVKDDYEQRLFHKSDFLESGMDYSAARDEFVAATTKEDGSIDLELLDCEGKYIETITGGDSRDCNPTFSRHNRQEVLYQTAGIWRGDDGFITAYSAESINKINIETGEVTELVSDERYDYLVPKDDSEGNLYCIRRPYQQAGYASGIRTLFYIVTFPFRFVVAVIRFLDAFTKLFSAEPLKPTGPDVRPEIDNKNIQVLGQTINLAKAERRAQWQGDASLVPGNWELVKMHRNGGIEVIARKISSFDIDEEGAIHFTNGFRVSELAGSRRTMIFKYKLIENIRAAQSSAGKKRI
jgi:hypothetical protein